VSLCKRKVVLKLNHRLFSEMLWFVGNVGTSRYNIGIFHEMNVNWKIHIPAALFQVKCPSILVQW